MSHHPSNHERADWASVAIDAFADETRMADEDRQTQLSDLLCDMMHFCDVERIDWHRCVARAQDHYREEVAEESDAAKEPPFDPEYESTTRTF